LARNNLGFIFTTGSCTITPQYRQLRRNETRREQVINPHHRHSLDDTDTFLRGRTARVARLAIAPVCRRSACLLILKGKWGFRLRFVGSTVSQGHRCCSFVKIAASKYVQLAGEDGRYRWEVLNSARRCRPPGPRFRYAVNQIKKLQVAVIWLVVDSMCVMSM